MFLQSMVRIESEHSVVYQKLVDGFHVVWRSERKWARLTTDLGLEQVLMKSMKMSGGLTRGWGMTEQQRLIWLLSMHWFYSISFIHSFIHSFIFSFEFIHFSFFHFSSFIPVQNIRSSSSVPLHFFSVDSFQFIFLFIHSCISFIYSFIHLLHIFFLFIPVHFIRFHFIRFHLVSFHFSSV